MSDPGSDGMEAGEVEWLVLAAFGMMWVACLWPARGRRSERRSEHKTVDDFERRMELLAYSEVQGTTGRWIVTPRKGMRFLGPQDRQRARARARRRQVLNFLIEGLGISFLIGLVQPLRVLWAVTGIFGVLLLTYVWLLLTIKARAPKPNEQVRAARVPEQPRPLSARYVADGVRSRARETLNGLGTVGEGDRVHVVVRAASAIV